MKKDLNTAILDPYKNIITIAPRLEVVCYEAVVGILPEDRTMSMPDKLTLHRISIKIATGGVVDFSIEELSLIKERIGKVWSSLVVGAAYDILDADYKSESEIIQQAVVADISESLPIV